LSILAALEGLNSTLDDRKIKDITEKMKTLLPANPKSEYQANEELIIDLNPWSDNTILKKKINLIRKAINSKNIIKFNYINRKQEQLTRKAEPISLVLKGNSWYLYAFCLLRNDFRIFKLTRIRELNLLDEFYEPRNKKFRTFEEENSWNESAKMVHLVLKFKSSSLLLIQDYFADEKMEIMDDGDIVIRVDYPEDEWIIHFLLGFGDNLEVLEPERYRKLLKEKADSIARQYS
ncbi:MAG: WYL domain-containing protein, partial [Halanaerobiaceae bacterium]|nr:WYL domain-containing protein [Halanaerobiaceae bacterium]